MDLSFYYELICRQPLLTKEEEYRLLEVYHNPESSAGAKKKAKDTILNANLRFAFKRAKILSKGNADQFEELISAGNEGLIVALDKFKPSKDVRFLTYAGWWVRQRQLYEMAKMRIVPVPIWKQQLSSRIMRVVESFETAPTCEQIQEKMPEVATKDIRELYGTRYLTFYLEDLSEEEVEVGTFLEDMLSSIDEELVNRKIAEHLTAKEAEAISLSFGLDDGRDKTIVDIALVMNISREEVKTLRRDGMAKLKEVFSAKKEE